MKNKDTFAQPLARSLRLLCTIILTLGLVSADLVRAVGDTSSVLITLPNAPWHSPPDDGAADSQLDMMLPAALQSPLPMIEATKTDELLVDADGNGVVNPGDTLRYTVVINNNGDGAAQDVVFSDTVDANTTWTGALTVTPLAIADGYRATGNNPLVVDAANGLLANDTDADDAAPNPPYNDGLSVSASDTASALGGVVSVNADGSFTYNAPLSVTSVVTDSFTYTIQDADGLTDTGTVTVSVTGVVWYVDNTAPPGGDGSITAPFDTLAQAEAASSPTHYIFVYEGDGTNTGQDAGITLKADQHLIGQGVDLVVGGDTLVTATRAPIIGNSGGDGITLADNNDVQGLQVDSASGMGITGAGVSDGSFQNVTVTNAGGVGLNLLNSAGTFSFGDMNVNGATGTAFNVNGGTATIIYEGDITNAVERTVEVDSYEGILTFQGGTVADTGGAGVWIANSGGNVSFGDLNLGTAGSRLAGDALTLDNNSGVYNLSGLNIFTDGGRGFVVRRSGTLNVVGGGNTISTTNGVAISVANTLIGAGGVTFENVSASSGSNGIVLDHTVRGSFTLNGGTIRNTTGDGIYLDTVRGVTLDGITVDTPGAHGINGNIVEGFILRNGSVVQNAGQDGLHLTRLYGTVAAINDSTVVGSYNRNVCITNTIDTLDSLSVNNSNLSDTDVTNGQEGLYLAFPPGYSGTVIQMDVVNSRFTNNRTAGLRLDVGGNSRVGMINVISSTFSGNGAGVDLGTNGSGDINFNVSNNVQFNGAGTQIRLANNGDSASRMEGYVRDNAGIVSAPAGAAFGVQALADGDGDIIVQIDGNTITAFGDSGIDVASVGGSGNVQATLSGNLVSDASAGSWTGISMQAGNNTGGETNTLCVNLAINTATAGPGRVADYYLEKYSLNTTFDIQGLTPPTATPVQVENYVAGTDTNPAATARVELAGTTTNYTAGACTTPAVMRARDNPRAVKQAERPAPPPSSPQQGEGNGVAVSFQSPTLDQENGEGVLSRPVLPNAPASGETISLTIGMLPAGKRVVITFDVTIDTPFPAGVTQVANQGHVGSSNHVNVDTDDPDTPAPDDPTVTSVRQANLALSKSDSDDPVLIGMQLTYILSITNNGPDDVANVTLTDTLPSNMSFVTSVPGAPTCTESGGELTCNLGALNNGSDTTVVVIVDVGTAASGVFTNTASVSSSAYDPDLGDNTADEQTYVSLPPGVTLIESDDSTDVAEGGASDSYVVVLDARPTTTVTLAVTPDAQTDLGTGGGVPIALVFAPDEWDTAQSVTVSAVDDDVVEGLHSGVIHHSASSGDSGYHGLTIPDVSVNITDNDVAGVPIAEPGGSTDVVEGGASDSYGVALNSQPTAAVTLTITPDTQTDLGAGGGNPIALVFAPGDWDTVQSVTVNAVDDDVIEGLHNSTIRHSASSDDGNYEGLAVPDVSVNITDNDVAGVPITESDGSTDVVEGGASDSYAVALNSQPASTVTLTITPDAQTDLGAGGGVSISLVFVPGDWDTAQSVTVSAVDDDVVEGLHNSTIRHSASSDDGNYEGLAIPDLNVNITDNENTAIYLPLLLNHRFAPPDLVVVNLVATSDNITVAIQNQIDAPIYDEFWVDVYIDPDPPPSAVNQVWDQLSDQGLAWGVTEDAFAQLETGGVLTLTVGDAYYRPEPWSQVSWPLAVGTSVYAQVDSYNVFGDHGAVLELHEFNGEPYNNISPEYTVVTTTMILAGNEE
jgi:uncharacterized repeat protein (TIGR01451 family)